MRSVAFKIIRFSDWILRAKELLVEQPWADGWVRAGGGCRAWLECRSWERCALAGPAHSSAQMTGLGPDLLFH